MPATTATATAAGIRLLVGVRWLSVATMAGTTLLAGPLLGVPVPFMALLSVLLGMAAFNLFTLSWLARASGTAPSGRALLLQLLADTAGWSCFLYFTGGATNPLISMLLPLVAIGAALLPAAQAWLLAGLAIAAYSLLWQHYLPLAIADEALAARWHLAGMWLTFALSALVIVGFVVRMNATLRRRDSALAAANAAIARDEKIVALGNLAAGAAHSLGTPLGTLRILVDELLRETPAAPQLREDLELMGRQVEQCRQILTRLTAEAGHARAEGGGRRAAQRWLRETVAQWQAQRPGVAVSVQAGDAPDGLALVVDATLTQALHTLVNNAADAHPAHHPEPVTVTMAQRAGQLVVEVCDRGAGMSAQRRSEAGLAPRADGNGLGIGLFLARRALEHGGGHLELDARPGGGTIARLRIPLASPSTEDRIP